ncbi:MAG: TlpA family protein disulfide reductase [Halobacteriota archaeon]
MSLPMKRHIPVTAIVSVLLIFSIVPSFALSFNLLNGQNGPDFHLADLSNAKHSLSDYKGSIVVLDFFSVKCSTCQDDAKNVLVPLYINSSGVAKTPSNNSSGVPTVQFLSVETTGASADAINTTYINPTGITWPVLTGGGDIINLYKTNGTPTAFIVDPTGKIVGSIAHPLDIVTLKAIIDPLLEASANATAVPTTNPSTSPTPTPTPSPTPTPTPSNAVVTPLSKPVGASSLTSSEPVASVSTTPDTQKENRTSTETKNCSIQFSQQTSCSTISQKSLLCSPSLLMPIVSSTLSDQTAAISAEASALSQSAVPTITLPAETSSIATLPLESVYEFSLLGLGAPTLLIGVLYLLLRKV